MQASIRIHIDGFWGSLLALHRGFQFVVWISPFECLEQLSCIHLFDSVQLCFLNDVILLDVFSLGDCQLESAARGYAHFCFTLYAACVYVLVML